MITKASKQIRMLSYNKKRYQMVKIGIVYKLCCTDVNIKACYIGSTLNFNRRKGQHKSVCNNETTKAYKYNVYEYIRDHGGFGNWDMIELERLEYIDRRQLNARERYWVETLDASLNCTVPSRTLKEYYHDNKLKMCKYQAKYYMNNKPKILEYHAQYRQDHQEKMSEYQTQYRINNREIISLKKNQKHDCHCGGRYTQVNKTHHMKSNKHQNHEQALVTITG
jgi:hypothetical protein